MQQPWISNYWGKARPQDEVQRWHPLAWHMLDVAATMHAILAARPTSGRKLAVLLGLPTSEACQLMVWLSAIHDIGKFARPFQSKVPDLWHEHVLGQINLEEAGSTHHDEDGLNFFQSKLGDARWRDRIWTGADDFALRPLIQASVSHHGQPAQGSRDAVLKHVFGPGLRDAEACLEAITDLLLPFPIEASSLTCAAKASYYVAGLVTAADWLGSSQVWFPYEAAHNDVLSYWDAARDKAARAVRDAGYQAATPAPLMSFQHLTGQQVQPTPLQAWAQKVPLPTGPALFILEDTTGAGKTEAAQILVHRMLCDGRAGGAYWAMPTMATANAMYGRQSGHLRRLFEPDPMPSLALAHGQAALHDGFRDSLKVPGAEEVQVGDTPADFTASAACEAYLADDKRLSLLADIGAGTIDQAVLSVLPSRFNTVRLMGLAEKVLVIDEAHAYDPYVEAEMLRLLEFQAALGGSAIILSATLTNAQRARLCAAWRIAAGGRGNPRPTVIDEKRYPLATVADAGIAMSEPIEPANWSPRVTPIRLAGSVDGVLEALEATLAAGGCAAWVRNTPDDVLEAAALARRRGIEPLVFHARFAQADRQAIEAGIMARFGPTSTPEMRRGQLVIATQVIEQSLDLDFDTLASDLAPIDLLLQRAGRMRRHPSRKCRPDKAGAAMIVLSPDPVADAGRNWVRTLLPGTAAVYRNHAALWRTAREIVVRGALRVPDEVRALVEAVHGNTDCPHELDASQHEAEGKGHTKESLAKNLLLKLQDGYSPVGIWESEARIATRDSDPQTVVRLACRDASGRIVPWAPSEGRTPWQAWALSEVRVGRRIVPPGAMTLSSHAGELELIRAQWGRFERDSLVCVLEREGAQDWRGAIEVSGSSVAVSYSRVHGLQKVID